MARTQTHVHICAHFGDDLRYLTPDLWQSVEAGVRVVVVYLTDAAACSAEGRSYGSPSARHAEVNGSRLVRAAYAQLVAADPDAPWTETPDGIAQLGAVRLVSLGLHADQGSHGLDGLWREQCDQLPAARESYSRKQLVGTLAALLAECEPSLVRVLDPDAEHLAFDDDGRWIRSDDDAHAAAALFGLAAVERYLETARHPLLVESYRGQTVRRWPTGLDEKTRQRRTRLLTADQRQAPAEPDPADLRAAIARFSHSTRWLTLDGTGRLLAAAVIGGAPQVWRQCEPGSAAWTVDRAPLGAAPDFGDTRWSAATTHSQPLSPTIEAITAVDGRVHLFAQRLTLGVGDDEHSREAVTAYQGAVGGKFRPWEVLGGPNGNTDRDAMRRRVAGPPRAVALADGGVQFFLRNYGRGVSSRRRVFGHGWSPWLDLGGDGQDGLSVFADSQRRVHLVTPGEDAIHYWHQDGPDGAFTQDEAGDASTTGGPLTALDCGDGQFAVLTRQPDSAAVIGYVQAIGKPRTARGPVLLGAPGGYGPIAAALAEDGRLALATRGPDGRIACAWWDPRDETGAVEWTQTGPLLVYAPALTLDASGRMVLVALGSDAQFYAGVVDQASTSVSVRMDCV